MSHASETNRARDALAAVWGAVGGQARSFRRRYHEYRVVPRVTAELEEQGRGLAAVVSLVIEEVCHRPP